MYMYYTLENSEHQWLLANDGVTFFCDIQKRKQMGIQRSRTMIRWSTVPTCRARSSVQSRGSRFRNWRRKWQTNNGIRSERSRESSFELSSAWWRNKRINSGSVPSTIYRIRWNCIPRPRPRHSGIVKVWVYVGVERLIHLLPQFFLQFKMLLLYEIGTVWRSFATSWSDMPLHFLYHYRVLTLFLDHLDLTHVQVYNARRTVFVLCVHYKLERYVHVVPVTTRNNYEYPSNLWQQR